METGWRGTNIQSDWAIKIVLTIDAEAKLTAASFWDPVGEIVNADFEIWLASTDCKLVFEVFTLKSSNITDSCKIFAICRGRKCEF